MAEELSQQLEAQLERMRWHVSQKLNQIREGLRQEQLAHFERSLEATKKCLADAEAAARTDFETAMADAKEIPNHVLRRAYEDSNKRSLESTIKFQQQLLDDLIDRWKDELG
jgi:hypothetical protein